VIQPNPLVVTGRRSAGKSSRTSHSSSTELVAMETKHPQFVCHQYGTPAQPTVEHARLHLFGKGNRALGMLLPTRDALKLHAARANHQAKIWLQADKEHIHRVSEKVAHRTLRNIFAQGWRIAKISTASESEIISEHKCLINVLIFNVPKCCHLANYRVSNLQLCVQCTKNCTLFWRSLIIFFARSLLDY